MNTLSDKITISLSFRSAGTGFYSTYYISETTNRADAFFVGKVFVMPNTTSVNLYLNDILATKAPKNDILSEYLYMITKNNYKYFKTFYIFYEFNGDTPSYNTRLVDVLLVSRYQFLNYFIPADYIKSSTNMVICPLLQGLNYNDIEDATTQSLVLYPRYPKESGLLLGQVVLNSARLMNSNIKIVALANGEVEHTLWTVNTGDSYSTYFSLPISYIKSLITTDTDSIAITNSNITKHIITGKKLWKVSVEGQYLYQDQDMAGFVNDMGYPGLFYLKNFYIQEPQAEVVHMIVETNDPEKDIVEVYHDWLPRSGANEPTYEEIQYSPRWILAYEPHSVDPLSRLFYQDIVNFFGEFSDREISPAILAQWGIRFDTVMSDPTLLNMPFIVPERGQIETFKLNFEAFQDSQTFTYEDIFLYNTGEIGAIEGKYSTYSDIEIEAPIKIAEFDKCPAKYYVQWVDRYGGVQCLPFDGKSTKSTEYDKVDIANSFNESRLASAVATYNIELNTRYISDEQMPIYEGIFVSKAIKIYETETGIVYKVISIDDKYIEKTYNNQGKKGFNLTIKFEVSGKEKIVF